MIEKLTTLLFFIGKHDLHVKIPDIKRYIKLFIFLLILKLSLLPAHLPGLREAGSA